MCRDTVLINGTVSSQSADFQQGMESVSWFKMNTNTENHWVNLKLALRFRDEVVPLRAEIGEFFLCPSQTEIWKAEYVGYQLNCHTKCIDLISWFGIA